jgi:hypothetical protein
MSDHLADSQNVDEHQTVEPNYLFAGEVITDHELEGADQSFCSMPFGADTIGAVLRALGRS